MIKRILGDEIRFYDISITPIMEISISSHKGSNGFGIYTSCTALAVIVKLGSQQVIMDIEGNKIDDVSSLLL